MYIRLFKINCYMQYSHLHFKTVIQLTPPSTVDLTLTWCQTVDSAWKSSPKHLTCSCGSLYESHNKLGIFCCVPGRLLLKCQIQTLPVFRHPKLTFHLDPNGGKVSWCRKLQVGYVSLNKTRSRTLVLIDLAKMQCLR